MRTLTKRIALTAFLTAGLTAQPSDITTTVPRQVRISNTFHPVIGPPSPVESVTLSIYSADQGGTALWSEMQNVSIDTEGRYTVALGATVPGGVPADLFGTGEPRWLGVRVNRPGEVEQPRVQLVSVPYALKAADAETLGGRPASAYLLAPGVVGTTPGETTGAAGTAITAASAGPVPAKAGKPTPKLQSQYYLPEFTDNSGTLGNSVIYQQNSTNNIGIGTTSPGQTLTVVSAGTSPASFTSSSSGNMFVAVNSSTGHNASYVWQNNGADEWYLGNVTSDNSLRLVNSDASGNSTPLTIQQSGNVGIGTSNPQQALSVMTAGTNIANFASTSGGNTFVAVNSATGHNASYVWQNAGADKWYLGNVTSDNSLQLVNGDTSGNSTNVTFQQGGNVGIGTGSPSYKLDVAGDVNLSGILRYQSSPVLRVQPSSENLGLGSLALQNNSSGTSNTGIGYSALFLNSSGSYNTALGASALSSSSGSYNTAVGTSALFNTSGNTNTGIGYYALGNNMAGGGNIAIGYNAGSSVSSGNSNNIEIGNTGASGDSGTIRIGTLNTQTSFFAAGIGTTNVSGVAVMVDTTTGQLGVASSSRRYKDNIQDMGDVTQGLMRLRPVTFRYKKPFADGTKPIQYGLIAEEVADVYPDLVARSADGQIETVRYQMLAPMLLNEVQRQEAEINAQKAEIELLRQQITELKTAMVSLANGNER